VEPVQQVLSLGVEIERLVADVFAAVGEEGDLLVGLHPLGFEHFEQAPFGFGVVGLHVPETCGPPVCGMALPAITSNQPSVRERCWLEWT
jgi:hypothetical protein